MRGTLRASLVLGLVASSFGLSASVEASAHSSCGNRADFDGDGFADLAVGVPGETVDGESAAGAVNVIYGSPGDGSTGGLTGTGDQFWHQDVTGIADTAEEFDEFGSSLAAGDFNDDGFDDLAIGVPEEAIGEGLDVASRAGAVNVIYGSAGGLTVTGNQIFHQDVEGITSETESPEFFGTSLAACDFDGDGFADLAVGVPGEDGSEGAVNVLYGRSGGLSAVGDQFWHQDVEGIADPAQFDDQFGFSVAAGDFNNNGFADLAVGVPGEDFSGFDEGAVNVIYGRSEGLSAVGDQFWHQGLAEIDGVPADDERFGWSVAAGDFDNDGFEDLAVGVQADDISVNREGGVNVIYGATGGLTATDSQYWHQNVTGIASPAEANERFGWGVAAGDFDNNGFDDLAVGVPFERIGGLEVGAVNVLYGRSGGLSASGDQYWHQDVEGITDSTFEFDKFGFTVMAADFNANGFDDLAIGVPGEDEIDSDSGAVNVIYGRTGGLSATGDQFFHQSASGIADVAEADDEFGSALVASPFAD